MAADSVGAFEISKCPVRIKYFLMLRWIFSLALLNEARVAPLIVTSFVLVAPECFNSLIRIVCSRRFRFEALRILHEEI